MHLVAGESLKGLTISIRSWYLEWPIFIVLVILSHVRIECSIEDEARADHFTTLCQDAIVMLSTDEVNNLVLAVSEPIFVHLDKSIDVFRVASTRFGRSPLVLLVLSIVEEAAILGPNDSSKLFKVNFLNIRDLKTFRPGYFSEKLFMLSRLFTILVALDSRAHAVNSSICSYKRQVIRGAEYLNGADRSSLHHH